MPTNDRKDPTPNQPIDKKDQKITDLPARDASAKDEQVKGGKKAPSQYLQET